MTAQRKKACTKCGKEKSLRSFALRRNSKIGRSSECKACCRIRQNAWNAAHDIKLQYREKHLIRTFGITLDEYNRMFADQKGCCAICGQHQLEFKRQLAVDHNRKTSHVRGLLCGLCNTGLGSFQHRPEVLESAIQYLQQHDRVGKILTLLERIRNWRGRSE